MAEVEGTRTFMATGDEYDAFMGRYSRELAPRFADYCGLSPGFRFLDVGCGPGALTQVAVERLGADAVAGVDPAAGFVAECRRRLPGVDVRYAPAEALPFPAGQFDVAAAQLVFHFVSDPVRAGTEMRRVVRPGGTVAAVVWDLAEGMEMLRAFWDAALRLDPDAPDDARVLRFGNDGELASLFNSVGLDVVHETTMSVASTYPGFDDLWAGFLGGVGPAGAYLASRTPHQRERLRAEFHERLGGPGSAFTLRAVARAVRGTVSARSSSDRRR